MGFGQSELWAIIEKEYSSETVFVMNVDHPKYNGAVDEIIFED